MRDTGKTPHTNRSKKAYREPELQVYGDLREITQANGVISKAKDGGKPGSDKTH